MVQVLNASAEPAISVIVCTHNPRTDYLSLVVDALQRQTLPREHWELLVVDNGSDPPLERSLDLSWHPRARIVNEGALGLTNARLRGVKESGGDIIVFVDDDNVLDPDYLAIARDIAREWPYLGAWGGQIRPQFEADPPAWTTPLWPYLAIRTFEADRWSNEPSLNLSTPCGAGLVVRRKVAQAYAEQVATSPTRLSLDRKGSNLVSCGDTDLALTATDIGLGTAQFVRLKLTHLLPARRVTESYLLQLIEEMIFSQTILLEIRGMAPPPPPLVLRLLRWGRGMIHRRRGRRLSAARRRGLARARRLIAEHNLTKGGGR